MKLTVDHEPLAGAVAAAARAIPQRPPAPVLSGIRLAAADGTVEVSAFDYDVSSLERVTADVGQEGTAVVPGRLLAEIVRSMPGKPVELDADKTRLTVRCGASRFTLMKLPEEEYPALPAMPPLAGMAGSAALGDAVAQAIIATAKDDTLPALTAVLCEIRGSQVTLIATDRYRMAFRELDWTPARDDISADVLIPGRVLAEITRRAAASAETAIHLAPGDGPHDPGIAGFTAGGWQATTRLIAEKFPDVRSRIPEGFSSVAEVPREAFTSAIKRVALVAEPKTPIRITFCKGSARLEAGTGGEAQAREELDVDFDDGEFTIAFNPAYLADGINAAGGDVVRISLTNPARPALVTAAGDPAIRYRHVLMPIRSAG